MPGFGPAAELVAWCVPRGTTVVDSAKGPNTKVSLFETNQTISALRDAPCKVTSRLVTSRVGGRKPRDGGPTRCAHTRPADGYERPPLGPGGRRRRMCGGRAGWLTSGRDEVYGNKGGVEGGL